ncbi:uncharacterized protein [Nicotiana sylvestris]|uniref:uncharacterized protein n=1 Tax=Nicotiana sylvestris TaxID=4096 RepID=UPI00388CE909
MVCPFEGGKGVEGLNYEDLCIQPDVELPEGYKPPEFEIFDGIGDPKVHLRTYCDKLVGVEKDKRIRMKLFMRSLTGDALSWYISQNPKKWANWVSMASKFMNRFRFNTENAPDVYYIKNLKKKLTETFREYATRWRSEVAKVRLALEEEQMNKFFVRAHDPQFYERLMVIENHKLSNIIKLGERIEEGIKSRMVTNLEALQGTNKALQLGGISKKREVGTVMVAQGPISPLTYQTPPPTYQTPPPTYQTHPSTYQPSSPRSFSWDDGMLCDHSTAFAKIPDDIDPFGDVLAAKLAAANCNPQKLGGGFDQHFVWLKVQQRRKIS